MLFDVITIFPTFFSGPFDYGIIRRGRRTGLVEIRVHDLRDFTSDRHRTVDDRPFGGGEGMVLSPNRSLKRSRQFDKPNRPKWLYSALRENGLRRPRHCGSLRPLRLS